MGLGQSSGFQPPSAFSDDILGKLIKVFLLYFKLMYGILRYSSIMGKRSEGI